MRISAFLSCIVATGTLAYSQAAKTANEGYRDEAARSRVGATLTDEGRDARQRPEELIARLGIRPGMAVADVGTAVGYMLPYLSKAVGPLGVVYAEDIFGDFLAKAKERSTKLTNVKFVLGNIKSPEIPDASIDLALILDAYHHFDYPQEMMTSLRKSLKPNGRVAIVEYQKNEKSMSGGRALRHIRSTQAEFVKEIEGFGFRAVEVKDFIPDVQWIGIFTSR